MNTQKLLLPYQGKTVIETVVEKARSLVHDNIVVVLGSHHEQIQRQIGLDSLTYVVNQNYPEGMHTSVICGFRSVPREVRAVLVFLGDQPHIPAIAARHLTEAWESNNKGIAIPVYDGRRGHPVLFSSGYLNDMEKLDPETGLRGVINKNKEDILEVECNIPEVLTDMDTPEDYARLTFEQSKLQPDEGKDTVCTER